MRKNWFFILFILGTLFGSQQAFGIEIITNPLKDTFGPNDWIEIDLEIDGYYGGFENTGEFFVKEIEKIEEPVKTDDSPIIPDSIRNSANLWSNNQMTDDRFAKGIEDVIEEYNINIPNFDDSEEMPAQQIPSWFKNNAKWWSEGQITDADFTNSIEFLVKNGIIRV